MLTPNPYQRRPSWSEGSRFLRGKSAKVIILLILSAVLVYAGYIGRHSFAGSDFDLDSFLSIATAPLIASSAAEDNRAEIWNSSPTKPQVGKVHAVFGKPNPTYERALAIHRKHSLKMGHPMFVLRERILPGQWSKPAYILQIILQELSRPKEERLKWLLWVDADVVIMNPNIPLDIFIPPQPEFDYVNMLVSNDVNGLNNGVFLIRVNEWAVKLLSAILSFHHSNKDVVLKYSEQSGMEKMIKGSYWRKSVVHVPQFWFNPSVVRKNKPNRKNRSLKLNNFRPEGLLIHFANNRDGKRPDRMNKAMDQVDLESPELTMPVEETWYPGNITAFWKNISEKRTAKGIPKLGSQKALGTETGTLSRQQSILGIDH